MSATNRNRPRSTIARRTRRRTHRVTLYDEDIDTYRPRPTIARRAGRLVPPYGKSINTYLPMELLREILVYSIESNQMKVGQLASVCRYWRSVMTTIKTINDLPVELLREIFLYCIESNQMKSGQLASVCRCWKSVIGSMSHLWSTLRVGTWTETEQVTTWLQRAYPKKVIIDPQSDSESPSEAPMFAALQNSLTSTGQWNELTISSFPPEDLASQLVVQVASPMKVLKVLHVAAGCVDSPSFAHLLNLVPSEGPLGELRLHSSFASAHFLQPHWFPVLKNLVVLIVNSKDIDEPFELLPTFTQLQIFEADRLRLPFYEPNSNIPLLCTLRKLQLRACSVQWMAGRQFACLEECAILLPRHWEVLHQHEVQLPSCKKLTYHGHPVTTSQCFHVPEMRAMDLKSHDCNEERVYQHLRHLCRVDGRISKLTALHLTLQCSEQVLTKVLKYLAPLQELVFSLADLSPSWQDFLESLAAKPSTNEWPVWDRWRFSQQCEQWCSSQTWSTNILPHLKSLGIQCPTGYSQSERLDDLPLLRLVGWTRAYSTPPLEHLKVWEGRQSMGDIAVDYISTGYLGKHLPKRMYDYDARIVIGMVAGYLDTYISLKDVPLLHCTALFRQLQHLELSCDRRVEIPILPYLEQIKRLEIRGGFFPEYSLNIDIPLTRTLQWFILNSSMSWMLGRTFKALRECEVDVHASVLYEKLASHEGLQVNLPACTILELVDCPMGYLRFFSCSNVQIFRRPLPTNLHMADPNSFYDMPDFNSFHDFLFHLSCLQNLYIFVSDALGVDSLVHFVFCGALEKGVWRDIRSVEMKVEFNSSSKASDFIDQTIGQQRYGKRWKTFITERRDSMEWGMEGNIVTLTASM